MARRNGLSIKTIGISSIIIIGIVFGFLYFGGVIFLEEGNDSSYQEDAFFNLALLPNRAVSCVLQGNMYEKFTDGTEYRFGEKLVSGNPTFLSLTSSLKDKPISSVEFRPQIQCIPLYDNDKIDLVGGNYVITISAVDYDGTTKKVVDQKVVSITPQSNIGGRIIQVNPFTVTASSVQNVISKSVQSYTTWIKIDATFTPRFVNSFSGTTQQYAQLITNGQFLARVDNPVAVPTTSGGTIVRFASTNGILPLVYDKASTTNTVAQFQFLGELDKWTVAEGFPYVDIFAPDGIRIHSKVTLSSTYKDIGGGIFQFKRASFELGNRDTLPLGTYKVILHSNGDVRKDSRGVPITATMTFQIKDSRTTTTTNPVTLSSCPSATTYQNAFKSLTTEELQINLQALNTKQKEGTISDCEKQLQDLLKTEIAKRGAIPIATVTVCISPQVLDPISKICVAPTTTTVKPPTTPPTTTPTSPTTTEGAGTDDTITATVKSSLETTKAFINYNSAYTSISSETNRDCTDSGKVPKEGLALLPVTPLQLFSFGNVTCSSHRWAQTELQPVIDFGSSAKNVEISPINVKTLHKLYISLNNPFPANPKFDCSGGSATEVRSCTLAEVDLNTLIPNTSFEQTQVTKSGKFTDPSRINTQFELSRVKITEQEVVQQVVNSGVTATSVNALVDADAQGNCPPNHIKVLDNKCQRTGTGLALNEGDIISILVQVDAVVSGTISGQPVNYFTDTLSYTQDFSYNAGAIKCNPDTEYLDITSNTCKNKPRETCDPPRTYDEATNSCIGTGVTSIQCEIAPTCGEDENTIITTNVDQCGLPIYECKKIIATDPRVTSPDGEICITDCPTIKQPNANGGCDAGYLKNTLGQCQRIFTTVPKTDPNGGGGGVCLDPEGNCAKKPLFTLTGTTLLGIWIFVIIIIVLIIVAVILRRRRRGGGIIG